MHVFHISSIIGHAKYVTTIDLTKGYCQVPLDEDARIKSAFVTPFGHFQFNTFLFGLKNSGPAFQRLVDKARKKKNFGSGQLIFENWSGGLFFFYSTTT